MRFLSYLMLVLPLSLAAQITNVTVDGVTSVEAILRYTAPTASPCTVEVSENSSLSPLVHDVNPALFPNSHLDEGGARSRTFVIGKQRVQRASDGKAYSRALQTATPHYFRIACGEATATGSFVTAITPFGVTAAPGVDIENAAPLFPTIDRGDPTQRFIDPNTGVLFRKGVPLNTGTYSYFRNATGCEKGAGWSNLCNVTAEDGVAASYSGDTQQPLDALFYIDYLGEFYDPIVHFQLELKAHATATGERLRACRVNRHTDQCDGPIYESADLPLSPTTIRIPQNPVPGSLWQDVPTAVQATEPGSGRVWTSGSSTTVYFTRPSDCELLREQESFRSGGMRWADALYLTSVTVASKSCSANPPNVTLTYAVDWSGNGTNCPVGNDDSYCGYPFYFNSGIWENRGLRFRIWRVNTTPGPAVHIDFARLAMERSVYITNTSGGFHRPCSALENSNGFTLCAFNNRLVAVHKTSGEIRYLGGMHVYLGAIGRGSGLAYCGSSFGSIKWSHQEPNTLYCDIPDTNTGKSYLYRLTYTGTFENVVQTFDGIVPGPAAFKPSDFSLEGSEDIKTQIRAFTLTRPDVFAQPFEPDDWHCGSVLVSGTQDDVLLSCKLDAHGGGPGAIQDTITLLAVARRGQGVIAVNPSYASPACRWCTNHSIDDGGPKPVYPMQFQFPKEEGDYPGTGMWRVKTAVALPSCTTRGTCAPCPENSLDNILGLGLVTATGTTVKGSWTTFRHWLDTGATITIAGQTRTITSIPGDDTLIVSQAFNPPINDLTHWHYSLAGQRRCSTVTLETDSEYVDWTAGPGTVSVVAGSSTVTGAGTSFRSVLRYKDKIRINGEERVVRHIYSDESLIVDSPFPTAGSSLAWQRRYPDKPADYVNGNYPISKNYPRFLLRLAEGDVLTRRLGPGWFGEVIRLVKDLGNGQWVVQRAAGVEGTVSGSTDSHQAGDIFFANCSLSKHTLVSTDKEASLRWFYELDPVGANLNYTVLQRFVAGHAVEGVVGPNEGHAVTNKYFLSHFDPSRPESYKFRQKGDVIVTEEPPFAGKVAPCSGNFCESHPSYVPEHATGLWARTFFDHNPLLGSGTTDFLDTTLAAPMTASDLTFVVISSGQFPLTGPRLLRINSELVVVCSRTGNTFTVCPGGRGFEGTTAAAHAAGSPAKASMGMHLTGSLFLYQPAYYDRPLDRKHFRTFAISGYRLLSDISGPGSFIGSTNSNAFQYCVAEAPGECRPGSWKGMIFANAPLVEPAFTFCSGKENPSGANDLCFFNWGQFANVVSQIMLPVGLSEDSVHDTTGKRVRQLGHLFTWPRRISPVANVKPVAGQRWLFAWMNLPDHTWNMLIKVPPFRAEDGVSRNTFVPVEVNVAKGPAGTHSAVIEFGYDKTFRCTTRNEKCIAYKTSIDEDDPFRWPAEGGITGVSCSNGCKIVVPAVTNRILYYQVVYRNASDMEIGRSARFVTAVP